MNPTANREQKAPKSGFPRAAALVLLGLAVGAGGTWGVLKMSRGTVETQTGDQGKILFYRNPMNPQITSPVFMKDDMGMDYIPVYESELKGEAASVQPGDKGKILFYRNPMNPTITSPVFKQDEMGMDYLPVYENEVTGEAPAVEGHGKVTIETDRQQLIGIKTAKVAEGSVGGEIRTNGRVAVDETRVRKINVKVEGFVERLFVDFVGKPVAKGQPLFSLYSPEFVSAQREYLLALKTQQAMSQGAFQTSGSDLLEAARRRLQFWDVPQEAVDRLEKTGEPQRTLTLRSPISGVVTVKNVAEGSRITPADIPFEITDLSRVWVLADAYETDLGRAKVGMTAELTLQSSPGRIFKGRVAFIDPLLDPKSRTAKLRIEFPNPKGELKPEFFGEVVLKGIGRKGLLVPRDAIMDSGTMRVAFVALGEGRFEPREVITGASLGEQVEILEGLKVGDDVVTRANFLVDSESRLRAALAQMGSTPAKKP